MNAPLLSHLFQEDLYHFTVPLVVILPKPWESHSTEEQILLSRILSSVKVDMNAVQIIVQPSVDLPSLKVYSPQKILIFGAETTEQLGLYEAITAHGFTVVRADDLSLLDDQKKKNLWITLRQMFGI